MILFANGCVGLQEPYNLGYMGSRINSCSLRINRFNVCMRMQLGVGVLVLVTPTPFT